MHHHHDHSAHLHSTHDDFSSAKIDIRRLALAAFVNLAFVILEAAYGLWEGSLALLSDAGHNLSDVLGLMVVWLTTKLAQKAPSTRFTYGLGSSTILAALANALFVLIAVGSIAWESLTRLLGASPIVASTPLIVVASLGILVNAGTALLLHKSSGTDLNVKSAYLHLIGDAAISGGVVVTGIIIAFTHAYWIDSVIGLVIAVFIVASIWDLIRNAGQLLLNAVPRSVPLDEVRGFLQTLPGVARIHDLHIWPLSTRETALTVHLVMPDGHPGDTMLRSYEAFIKEKFRIGHCTFQIERDDLDCPLAPDHIV